jgi:hypothetical protein
VESTGHVVHSGASVVQNVDTLFFMLTYTKCSLQKKCTRRCYTELVFFHQVGSAGHGVRSGASVAQNIDALFYILVLAGYTFDINHTGTRYAKLVFLHPV